MRPGLDVLNAVALLAAVVIAMVAAATLVGSSPVLTVVDREAFAAPEVEILDARRVLRDTGGHPVPLGNYQRIVSLSILSDDILCAICEPERLVAASTWSHGPWTVRLGALPRLEGLDSLEAVLRLAPDLVLVAASQGSAEGIARLREAGITVYALGSPRGLASFQRDALALGLLIGREQQARQLALDLERRMAQVAADLPATSRPRAIYLASYGGMLYGGTRGRGSAAGSSYHDVLVAGAAVDIAADRFASAWPELSVEQVMELAPDVIVTKQGMGDALRHLPGLSQLPLMQRPGSIIELPDWMLEHPGRPMLSAAEALRAALFPQP